LDSDQSNRLVEFLSDPATHGTDEPVLVIQTHAAMLFLAGPTAYKIKQPVRYSYLDFSTLKLRRRVLQRELELNKPSAPQIYRDLIPITRTPKGDLSLGGEGDVIEWALRMNRFAAEAELSQIAASGAFSNDLAVNIGSQIAQYHETSPVNETFDPRNLIGEILEELEIEFRPMTDVLPKKLITSYLSNVKVAFSACSDLLDARGEMGYVRRGHGDLHLRNMVCLDSMPVLFDALEFDEKLGTMDVLYDLAFLIMDMLHADLHGPANIVLNQYLFRTAKDDHLTGLAALPLFLSIRAAIRAMVAVQSCRLSANEAYAHKSEAVSYLRDAQAFLTPSAPRLVAVGGLSGTGKTTLAAMLAPSIGAAPGALHLRSDPERKALCGVDEFSHLPASGYNREISRAVYVRLHQKADAALRAGHSVILDAVHMNREQREAARALAGRVDVPFTGLWLEANAETLEARVAQRIRDASDADVTVVRSQLAADVGVIDWHRLDAGQDKDNIRKDAQTVMESNVYV
jgi:aminoglycoside phosphotransferase family enzyme/predicted kinase